MLGCPENGWSDFQLEGTEVYDLSYLDDIAFEWLEQAIHGLETMLPFCVKGYMEPGRFLCLVSYWNCHIVCEDDGRGALSKNDIVFDYSNTSMLEFCEFLYHDIKINLDDWVTFASFQGNDHVEERKKMLESRLLRLSELIRKRKANFSQDRCFI